MKKYLALLLALVLAFGVVLSACGGDKAPETTAPKADAGNDATDAPTDAPEEDEPAELREIKVWGINPLYGIEDGRWDKWMTDEFKTWAAWNEKMEELGIELVIEELDAASAQQTITNRVNAQLDLPDIISFEGSGVTQAEVVKYGQDGMFWEIGELLETYDEDGSIMAWMQKYASFPAALDENGDLWFIPYCNGGGLDAGNGTGIAGTYSFQLRADWLDALGIEYKHFMTPDEVFEVLKAFRDQDANGNGVADEVCHYISIGDHNFTGAFGMANGMIYCLSDGTVECQIDHPNFKAMVEFYQKLWNEGIISPDQFNEGWDPIRANRASSLFSYESQTWEDASIVGFEDTARYAPVCIDDDGGENGFIFTWTDATSGMLSAWAVNKDCADPQAIVDLLDYMCTEEFVWFSRYGIQGVHWDYNEDGKAVDLIPDSEQDYNDGTLGAKLIFNMIPNFTWNVMDEEAWHATHTYAEKYPEKHEWVDDVVLKANLTNQPYQATSGFYAMFTAAEQEAYNAVAADVNTYWNELMTDLLTGEKSVDDLATYRAELSELGLDTMIKIQKDRAARFWEAVG